MTTRISYFMSDFASTDRRSVKAHIEGRSIRAAAYTMFVALDSCIFRAEKAQDDYLALSRFFYTRRGKVKRVASAIAYITTSVVGTILGAGLYFWLVQ